MKTQYIEPIKLHFLSVLLPFLLLGSVGFSYGQSKHEVSGYVKGQISRLRTEVLQQKPGKEVGLGAGVQYSYYLSDNWSIGTGLEYQAFQGNLKIETLQDAYQTQDLEGEPFEFRYKATNYREQQMLGFLNVPLTVQYETSGDLRFFVAAGAKVGFGIQSEFEAAANSLVTSGYYEQYNVELHSPEFAGFGDFGAYETRNSELDLNTSYSAVLEAGIKLLLPSERSFYMGIFLDYGLNNILEQGQRNVVDYRSETPTSFGGSSLLSGVNNTSGSAFAEEVKPLAFGLKFRYAFGF